MTRRKIAIKKIDNLAARQVTFAKRRKGIFKKAQELAVLCDAEIALIVFSSSGKLYEYSSTSRVEDVVERRIMHLENIGKQDQSPDLELRLRRGHGSKLSEEVARKTHGVRQLMGEELEGLGIEELKELEKTLESNMSRAVKFKNQFFLDEINAFKTKGLQLLEENQKLRQKMEDLFIVQEAQRSRLAHSSGNSSHQDSNAADTLLKLGMPFSD